MSFDSILGQDLPKQILSKALENGNVAHAYLFYGPQGIGKRLIALQFAKALNCTESGPQSACNDCTSCHKISRGLHPDIFIVEPVKSTPTARESLIKIDPIRELQRKLSYLPYEGRYKVAIIDGAESMNLQAANTFLKTLEEPPGKTIIILIASNPNQMLPTINSRCQAIKFHPLTTNQVKDVLQKKLLADPELFPQEELQSRANRSMGQISSALDDDHLQMSQYRSELLSLIDVLSFDRMDVLFTWSKTWARRTEHLQTILDEMMDLLRDLVILKTTGNRDIVHNKDLQAELQQVAANKQIDTLLKMFDSTRQTKIALSGNANAQLSLESMLIQFCQAA